MRTQRLHFLEALGDIAHDRGDADHAAGAVLAQRRYHSACDRSAASNYIRPSGAGADWPLASAAANPKTRAAQIFQNPDDAAIVGIDDRIGGVAREIAAKRMQIELHETRSYRGFDGMTFTGINGFGTLRRAHLIVIEPSTPTLGAVAIRRTNTCGEAEVIYLDRRHCGALPSTWHDECLRPIPFV